MAGQQQVDACPWAWADASIIGTAHKKHNLPLQDSKSIHCIENRFLVSIVSDGAGSAKHSKLGSWLLCRTLTNNARKWFENNLSLPNDETVRCWIDDYRDLVCRIAEKKETKPREFASTLSALILTKEEILALHVGDSAIVGLSDENWITIAAPENGEYASTTYFVTDNPEPRLNIIRQKNTYNAFSLFTDGIGDISLKYEDLSPYPNFFNPMIKPLQETNGEGRLKSLSNSLGQFLESEKVCEKTDDDKTLILITEIMEDGKI